MTKHQAIPVLPVQDRIRGCLIGGAAGDALGYPVEFFSEQTLRERCGDGGIRQYLPDPVSGTARISDDTQMTLFTANGLLVGDNDRFLSFRRETVSDSIVIHPKNQPVVSLKRDLHLIIDILYYVLLIERRGYLLVYRGLRHFQDFRVSAKYLTSL